MISGVTGASAWYRPRVLVFVGILVASVLAAGVGSIVRYRAGYPLSPLESLFQDSTPEGRRELRALRKEPVLRFRAPGTELRSVEEEPAHEDWWHASQPTEISQRFRLKGEPGEVVDAYRSRAEAGGWRLVEVRCSFHLRSTIVTLTREVAGRPATLKVYGYLEGPLEPGQRVLERGVLVSLTGEAPERPPQSPLPVPIRQRDVHCLRNFDPDDPALVPPAVLPESSEAICGLLGPAEARRGISAVSSVKPRTDSLPGCFYSTAAGEVVFDVYPAPEPRASYEDDRSAQDPGDERFVLLDEYATLDGRPIGACVDTRIGPVRVHASAKPQSPGLDASQLTALARLLAQR